MSASQAGTCGCCAPTSVEVPPEPTEQPAEPEQEPVCYCPIDGLIDTVSRKYAMQIVSVVGARGPLRFKDLEERFPSASTSTLSNRLEELSEAGLISRESFDEVPPHVEYELTAAGRELERRIEPLLAWASETEPEAEG